MLNFTAIDFETANSHRGSPCSVGLVKVAHGKIVDERYLLIQPPEGIDHFDGFNISIHGITPSMVADAPRWKDVLPEILEFIGEGPVFAHNAGFDMSVIRYACAQDEIACPELMYLCTYAIARRTFSLPLYRLPFVTEELGVKFSDHHNALADARAVANIVIQLAERAEVDNIEDLARAYTVIPRRLFATGSQLITTRSPKSSAHGEKRVRSTPVFEVNVSADPDGDLFGRTVVFTGALTSMTRNDAKQLCAQAGGVPEDNTTKRTNILVVGEVNPASLRPGVELSRKMSKAVELQAKGQDIEIMAEDDFLRCLSA